MYSGSTPVTDTLFGIRYLIADESDNRGVPEFIHNLYTLLESTEDHLDIYENPYALSLGYTVDGGHFTHAGYTVLTDTITPVLKEILGK